MPPPRRRSVGQRLYPVVRLYACLLAGLFVVYHETVREGADRPWLIAAGLVLMGFPLVSGLDDWLRRR